MAKSNDPGLVRLRPIAGGDWPRVHEWAQIESACRYQPWGPNTPEETESFVAAAVAAWSVRPQTRYVCAAVTPADQVVGIGEVHVAQGRDLGEISYAVHHEHWRRGIGAAIGRLLRDFGFEALHLHRVEATCDPRNLGSSESCEQSAWCTRAPCVKTSAYARDGATLRCSASSITSGDLSVPRPSGTVCLCRRTFHGPLFLADI